MDFWAKGNAEAVKVSLRPYPLHKPMLQKHFLPAPVFLLPFSLSSTANTFASLSPPYSLLNPRVSMLPLFQGQVNLKKRGSRFLFLL
jgi:hypothetical protein